MLEREMKRGSTELLILALLEDRERHGYEIGKLIDERSDGTITFQQIVGDHFRHLSGHLLISEARSSGANDGKGYRAQSERFQELQAPSGGVLQDLGGGHRGPCRADRHGVKDIPCPQGAGSRDYNIAQ